MKPNFARKELASLLWFKQGIVPCTVTDGNTVNTYTASPQPAAGIDSWDAGNLRFRNLLLLINVASITAGKLEVKLYDSPVALTTAGGAAAEHLVATVADITAAGQYYVEFQMDQEIFPAASARVVAHADACEIMRYLSVKATSTGGDTVFNIDCIFGNNLKNFPSQDSTVLAATYNES